MTGYSGVGGTFSMLSSLSGNPRCRLIGGARGVVGWFLWLIVIWSVAAAFASWHVASKQGRDTKRWALWTLLFAGLPLIWLIICDLFALPTFGSAKRHTCCDDLSWTAVADFDHAGGVDLDLGKCENCGAYLMAVSYVESTNYVVISNDRAEYLLSLHGTPELKKVLKNWMH